MTLINILLNNEVLRTRNGGTDEGCKIGADTKIWHFSHIMPNCEIGLKCNIGQNVVVSPDVKLGNNVKVQTMFLFTLA